MNSFDWISKWALYSPDKTAFKEYETVRSITYLQLNTKANKLAAYVQSEFNLVCGDRIAVLAENNLEYIILFAVAQKIGITIVPLNYRLSPREINYLIDNSKPKLIYTEEGFLHKVESEEAYKQCKYKFTLESLHAVLSELDVSGTEAYKKNEFNEDHPLFLIYTSGTTAFPKGAIYSHKMLYWNAINTHLRLDIVSSDRAINCAPPFHTGSWNVLLTPFILHGAYTLLMRNFDARAVNEEIQKDQHTIFWGVPTMLRMMSEAENFQSTDFSRLRYFIVGGEAMPIPLINLWAKKSVPVRQGYGLTEVGPNVTSLNEEDVIRKQGSIGKANFFYTVKLVDENLKDVGVNEIGEFLIKAPTVTPGYWNNAEATEKTILDGWFRTGDLMRQDEEGYLYVVDRIKNMYISGGENVYPAEVEHYIQKFKGVSEIAIIGIPDEKWGESGKAFIVKKKDQDFSAEDIFNFCKGNLAKYKIPKQIEFIESLPKTESGKIDRKALKMDDKFIPKSDSKTE